MIEKFFWFFNYKKNRYFSIKIKDNKEHKIFIYRLKNIFLKN